MIFYALTRNIWKYMIVCYFWCYVTDNDNDSYNKKTVSMQIVLLTFGVGNIFDSKSWQNGTCVKCVDVFDTALKRHMTVSSCCYHQGVIEQE